jgi:hypothetical protein
LDDSTAAYSDWSFATSAGFFPGRYGTHPPRKED